MTIPSEIIPVLTSAVIALQAWTLKEIISLKVKMARYEELEKRVEHLEAHRA